MRNCGCHSHNGLLLSPEGLAQWTREGPELAGMVATRYLDRVGSVSGLRRDEIMEDLDYDPSHTELNTELVLNGS